MEHIYQNKSNDFGQKRKSESLEILRDDIGLEKIGTKSETLRKTIPKAVSQADFREEMR